MLSVFYFNEMFCFGGFKWKYSKSLEFTTRGQKILRNSAKKKKKKKLMLWRFSNFIVWDLWVATFKNEFIPKTNKICTNEDRKKLREENSCFIRMKSSNIFSTMLTYIRLLINYWFRLNIQLNIDIGWQW